ncbi:MAG: DUF3048 domain-containing protein [Actinomycetota bacterium]|nr:DUF3048 domain-containing protein [Actinomycetota bacterium]
MRRADTHTDTSTRKRWWPIVAVLVLATVLATVGGQPAGAVDEAALRARADAIESAMPALRTDVATARSRLAASAEALEEATEALAAADDDATDAANRRAGVDRLVDTARVLRDDVVRRRAPVTDLRDQLAIMLYVSGDPRLASMLEELTTTGANLDAAAERFLFTAVSDEAFDAIELLDAEERAASIVAHDLTTAAESSAAGHLRASDAAGAAGDRLAAAETERARRERAQIEAASRLAADQAALEQAQTALDAANAELAQIERDLRPTTTTAPPAATTPPATTPPQLTPPHANVPTNPGAGVLTGLGTGPARPALAVKIHNVGSAPSGARPQSGINQADIVYEEKVEGGLTRFVAVFHSNNVGTVGPVRSARTSDTEILASYNRPLIGYSGANAAVEATVAASSLVPVGSRQAGGAYWRSGARPAPHNLYTSTGALWSAPAGNGAGIPGAQFAYRAAGEALPANARPARLVDVRFPAASIRYEWNGAGWARGMNGSWHVDTAGAIAAPENVIVQFINYRPSTADARSPHAVMTGSGEAWIFTAGHVVPAAWSRPNLAAPTSFTVGGQPVKLTPGRTWVALAEPGTAAIG